MADKLSVYRRYQNLPTSRKGVLWFITFLLLYTVIGFLIVPPVAKSILQKKIPEAIGRQVFIKKITANPFTLQIAVEGFSLKQKNTVKNDFISFKRLDVNLESASIWKMALIIKSISLLEPAVHCRRNTDLTYNFSDLLTPAGKSPPADKTFKFSINNIHITDGTVLFDDRPRNKLHKITRINLALPTVSNLPYKIQNYIQPNFSGLFNNTKFALEGETKPFAASRQTTFNINIKGINIPDYSGYITTPGQFKLSSAVLGLHGSLGYRIRQSGQAELSFTGRLTLDDIRITDNSKIPYFTIPRISAQFGRSNLLQREIKLNRLTIEKPVFTVTRFSDGRLAPLCLIPAADKSAAQKSKASPPSSPVRLTIKDFSLRQGAVNFNDETASPFKTNFSPLEINISNFSTIPGRQAAVSLNAVSESGEKISLRGQTVISPFTASGTCAVDDISLRKYEPYLQQFITPKISTGKLSLSTTFNYSRDGSGKAETLLTDISLALRQLIINDKHGELISLPELKIQKSSLDLEAGKADIGTINLQNLNLRLLKEKNGTLNISHLLASPAAAGPKSREAAKPWAISLEKAVSTNAAIIFTDNSLKNPLSITADKFSFTLAGLANSARQGRIKFKMAINKGGSITGAGDLALMPLNLKLNLNVQRLGIPDFQPYISDFLSPLVTNGRINISGNLAISRSNDKLNTSFTGSGDIADFTAIDGSNGNDLIKLANIDFSGFKTSGNLQNINIGQITIKDFFAGMVLDPAGKLNFSGLLKKSGKSAEKPVKPAAEPPNITIGRVVLKNADLNFLDHRITPSFNAAITDINGDISGLSTNSDSTAKINISGKVNERSPMSITGRINPLKDPLYADLKLSFQDIELSPASPYTGRYIAYKTKKGKLSLNLRYLINDKKIEADNKIFLDQFTLGDKVDSPEAVNLPINLALALLKNRQGEITLDIPIEGDLTDPQFSVSGVITKIIFNMITKAVTSPFALLGALIPDGEDLNYISFEPGSAELLPSQNKKLAQMAKVLYERPGLQADLIGRVSSAKDSAQMNDTAFLRLLKLEKARQEKLPLTSGELDKIEINQEEYPQYLELAYKSMFDRKNPRSKGQKAWGLIKGIFSRQPKPTVAEMENFIKADVAVNDNDLRLLANKRAENVLNYLLEKGPVKQGRLFIIEPQLQDTAAASNSGMSVEIVIK